VPQAREMAQAEAPEGRSDCAAVHCLRHLPITAISFVEHHVHRCSASDRAVDYRQDRKQEREDCDLQG
jgi:hypothetical protein